MTKFKLPVAATGISNPDRFAIFPLIVALLKLMPPIKDTPLVAKSVPKVVPEK